MVAIRDNHLDDCKWHFHVNFEMKRVRKVENSLVFRLR